MKRGSKYHQRQRRVRQKRSLWTVFLKIVSQIVKDILFPLCSAILKLTIEPLRVRFNKIRSHQNSLFSLKALGVILVLGLSIAWWKNKQTPEGTVIQANESKLLEDPIASSDKLEDFWQRLTIKEEESSEVDKQLNSDSWGFERWSVLDNRADGYRFAYPVDYEVDFTQGNKIEVKSKKSNGLVLIYLKDDQISIKTYTEGLTSDEEIQVVNARNFIEATFERFTPETDTYRKR